MKSPEYIAHGTSSEKDAEKIKREGFVVQEGRATVSTDLIYAFEWAKNKEKRKGSKSKSEIGEKERGRIIIMETPKDKLIGYATHTDIEIHNETKEVTGYSSKNISGRRQLAIYNESEVTNKKEKIEQAKNEIKKIGKQLKTFFEENNIDSDQIQSKEDLIKAIQHFDIKKKIEILKKAENIENQRLEKRKEAEPDIKISQENVLMSIVPTTELGEILDEFQQKIKNLEKIDLENFTEKISEIINNNKENFISSNLNISGVINNLLVSTIETEIMNMMRSLSMDVKRAHDYKIYNRGKDEVKEKIVDKKQLKQKLKKIQSIIEASGFDIGIENLNRYIKINIKRLSEELK